MNTKHSSSILLALAALAAASLACSLGDILFPRAFYVTKTVDLSDGECTVDDCSLREAVMAANATTGHNEIIVPPGFYLLNATDAESPLDPASVSDLDFTDGADIHGQDDREPPVIDIGGAGRAFEIHESVRVEMRGMWIQNGNYVQGGAIYNAGELILTDMRIQNNIASIEGGGIYNRGELTLQNVTIVGNTTGGSGGGISNYLGTISVNPRGPVRGPGTIFGNSAADDGGGIYNGAGRIELAGRFVISSNAATNGGGIYNAGEMELTDIPILGNQAALGGGIYTVWSAAPDSAQALRINVQGNSATVGAGIFDENSSLVLEQSSIVNNAAGAQGSGIYFGPFGESEIGCRDQANLVNVTLTGNATAEGHGGAIFVNCGANLTNVTIANNPAGGLVGGGPTIHLARIKNVLLSNNAGLNCGGASIDSLGHNLEDANTCGLTAPGDQPGTIPLLGALVAVAPPSGGMETTYLFPLLVGSPAINTGDNVGCPAVDQRGAPRPFGTLCDIGAFEFGAAVLERPVAPTELSPTVTALPTGSLAPSSTAIPSATNTLPPLPSATFTRTPQPPTFTPTSTPTQGLIVVTIGPLLPTSTPIP